jgi:hypothetical protein
MSLGLALLPEVNKTAEVAKPAVQLTQEGLEHIVYRHWATSGFENTSKFAPGTTGRELKQMINEAVENGTARPNTNNRPRANCRA